MPPEQTGQEQTGNVSRRALRWSALVIGLLIVGVVVSGVVSRQSSDAKLREWTDAQAIPTVAVSKPNLKPSELSLTLPGRLEAYSRAAIFARVSGYLKSWNSDIGKSVKAGDLLAEIEAPDLDQQLLQGRADLANSQAAATLSGATLKRRQTLLSSNFVSLQEIDERSADLASKEAQVKAQQANVDRLLALASFKNVTAPFDGVVTERNTDVGALITGGAGGGAPMFVVSEMKKLRVYVNVPQSYVSAIAIGGKATISVPEFSSRSFGATIEASSQSVDVATGTTRILLALDNSKAELKPGGYATVSLSLIRDNPPLAIPSSALIFDKNGLRVATVDAQDRIQFKTVTIARDLGREIEIATGLTADDRVITTPPDGVVNGDQVRIAGSAGEQAPPKTKTSER